jgi:hypothetical protein
MEMFFKKREWREREREREREATLYWKAVEATIDMQK